MSVFVNGATIPLVGKRLSDFAEGDIVRMNEGGAIVDFYVACHDYESGLNGTGRTLLVRKDCFREDKWDKGTGNAYAISYIDNWLNTTYISLLTLESNVDVSETTFYYTPGYELDADGTGINDMTVSTLTRKVFLLSGTELGKERTYCNVEGSALPTASLLEFAQLYGEDIGYWTRSPKTDTIATTWVIRGSDGALAYGSTGSGVRPCFTLPSTAWFDEETSEFVGVA